MVGVCVRTCMRALSVCVVVGMNWSVMGWGPDDGVAWVRACANVRAVGLFLLGMLCRRQGQVRCLSLCWSPGASIDWEGIRGVSSIKQGIVQCGLPAPGTHHIAGSARPTHPYMPPTHGAHFILPPTLREQPTRAPIHTPTHLRAHQKPSHPPTNPSTPNLPAPVCCHC